MGFAAKSVSMMRYRVKGEPLAEGTYWDRIDIGVQSGSHKKIEAHGDLAGMGWVSISDFTNTDFTTGSYARTVYVMLGFRIDTARVPARTLEVALKEETRKLLALTDGKRLSGGQRRELKESLKAKLKKQMLPSIQVHDMIWDTAKDLVYFASHATKARERFEDHFKKHFGFTLVPLIPFILAGEIDDEHLLEQIRPSSMVA